MGIEIERKFLLRDERWRSQIQRSIPMAQAYLGGDKCSVRVRLSGDEAWLTIKSAIAGSTRQEFEYPIPLADGQALLQLAGGPSISKVRHEVLFAGRLWEIDEFDGTNKGLLVAEIELETEDAQLSMPPWVGTEVTDQRRYYNSALARHPYGDWKDA